MEKNHHQDSLKAEKYKLNVTQAGERFKATGKVPNTGKWVPHQLNRRRENSEDHLRNNKSRDFIKVDELSPLCFFLAWRRWGGGGPSSFLEAKVLKNSRSKLGSDMSSSSEESLESLLVSSSLSFKSLSLTTY
uniref:Uncharacterized protein n=1 Tax=Glossina pallidipes TaxID=7398 RepID=A0A1A9ZWM0_GLOPL